MLPPLVALEQTQSAVIILFVSCLQSLSSLGESLPFVPDAYEYHAAVALSDVHGVETRVHIPAHGGSEA
ncbi:hypothetical protein Tco_0198892 [Tanacetum coccineum]